MSDNETSGQFCDCKEDGWCNRYQREQRGRWREICQGVNVDLGTAAAFRTQWTQEALLTAKPSDKPRQILLVADQAPGDMVAMTAAIYSLHRAHPGKYLTAVQSLHPEVFLHNPDVVPVDNLTAPAPQLHMHYAAIHQCNDRAIHFMQSWCEHLGAALGINVPLLTSRPRLYFVEPEPVQEDYWLICGGGKNDFTAKQWGGYERVVSILKDRVRFIQVGGANDNHPRMVGTTNMVGRTNLRQLFALVRAARGVVCGVSLLMHVAAALGKPAVVIAGGREPVAWNAYPRQQYVHTVGALPCTSTQGHVGEACWRSRVVPLGDGTAWDKNPCERPIDGIPECMRLISPAAVAELVLRYTQ